MGEKRKQERVFTKESIRLAHVVLKAILTVVPQGSVGVALVGVDIAHPYVERH